MFKETDSLAMAYTQLMVAYLAAHNVLFGGMFPFTLTMFGALLLWIMLEKLFKEIDLLVESCKKRRGRK